MTTQEFEIAAQELAEIPTAQRAEAYAYAVRLFKRLSPRFSEIRFENNVAKYSGRRETGQLDTPKLKA